MARQVAKDLVKELKKQGFTVEHKKSGHAQVTGPDGRSCQLSLSPSDYRGVRNAEMRMRKSIGYEPRRK